MKRAIVTLFVVAALVAPHSALAQDRVFFHQVGPGGPMPGMMLDDPAMLLPPIFLNEKVGLSDAQRKKIGEILQHHHQALGGLFEKLRVANEALGERLFDAAAKREDLEKLLGDAMQARQNLMRQGLAVALDVRGVLTPEQLAKAVELRSKMRDLQKQMQELMGGPFEMGFAVHHEAGDGPALPPPP
jgi:heavy-metal resistance protein